MNDILVLKVVCSNKDWEKIWGLICLFYLYKRYSVLVGLVILMVLRLFLVGSDKCNKVKYGSLIWLLGLLFCYFV